MHHFLSICGIFKNKTNSQKIKNRSFFPFQHLHKITPKYFKVWKNVPWSDMIVFLPPTDEEKTLKSIVFKLFSSFPFLFKSKELMKEFLWLTLLWSSLFCDGLEPRMHYVPGMPVFVSIVEREVQSRFLDKCCIA